jgi:hypothetical protein
LETWIKNDATTIAESGLSKADIEDWNVDYIGDGGKNTIIDFDLVA